MATIDLSTPVKSPVPEAGERLDSWKEIAAYLKRDERTVRRWEEEGLPVHRLPHKRKATVYAYKSEIDAWWNKGHATLEIARPPTARRRSPSIWVTTAGLTLVVLLSLGFNIGGARDLLRGRVTTGEIYSIAVLPLRNLSGDPAQDYFADGLTEELITRLGQISALDVISHQSVRGYRDTAKPLPQIARELTVHALLEGTVLHAGNRVRITANLVQAAPERHLWAESYEFDPKDVLAIQSDVARDVVNRIRGRVTVPDPVRLATKRRVDPEAYEAYLLGRAYLVQPPTATSWNRAKDYFHKAIEKEPAFAPSYASLAELYMRDRGAPTRSPSELRRQARQWAERALKLDDALAEAHHSLAKASQQEWDWVGAEREYRRAIELNPNYPRARVSYAQYLGAMRRFEEALAEIRRAQQLDPVSPEVNTWAGSIYLNSGRTREGMAFLQKALELDPRFTDANMVRARTYITGGTPEQAVTELQQGLTLKKEREPLVLGALAHAYAKTGQREEALKLVAELERIDREAQREYVPPFGLIWAYAGLGDRDRAFAWLERAYEMRADRMVWIHLDSFLVPLRSDPRFTHLVRRIGLPQR